MAYPHDPEVALTGRVNRPLGIGYWPETSTYCGYLFGAVRQFCAEYPCHHHCCVISIGLRGPQDSPLAGMIRDSLRR